jgi:hypothetical protein
MPEPSKQRTVTVRVFCYEDQPAYKVLWEPTGDEFLINPGDDLTFTFRQSEHVREDWTDIEMGVGAGWMYLGGSNFDQQEVIENGEVIWS